MDISNEDEIYLTSDSAWRNCISYNHYQFSPYSNKYDLKKHSKRTRTASRCDFTVRLESAFSKSAFSDNSIASIIRPLHSSPFSGRRVDRNIANLGLVRDWLGICNTHHMGLCIPNDTSRAVLPRGFRLIDVTRNKIATDLPDLKPRYVALTYVWGEDKMDMEMPRTLKASVHTAENGVELIDLPRLLPRTIRDAIEVTRSLGFTYLWVDSLCIIQDDKEDRNAQINMMDGIYRNATLTIAAGSTEHADSGLAGISIPRRARQQTERIKSYEFAVALPSFCQIDAREFLEWNTRGWTFQEKVLSKRVLLFTDIQMYFRCGNASFAEDVAMETGPLSRKIQRKSNPLQFRFDHNSQLRSSRSRISRALKIGRTIDEYRAAAYLPIYAKIVLEYSRRNFTFKNDSLDAISGVLRALDPSKLAFFAGLPRRWLLQALLWQPIKGHRYSIDYDGTSGIPSWSWAAWSFACGCSLFVTFENVTLPFLPPIAIYYKDSVGRSSWIFEDWTSRKPKKLPPKSWPELSNNARQHMDLCGIVLGFQTCVGIFGIGPTVIGYTTRLPEDEMHEFYLIDEAGRHIGAVSTCSRVAGKLGTHQFIALFTGNNTLTERQLDRNYWPKKSTLKEKFPYTGRSGTHNKEVIKRTGEKAFLYWHEWKFTDVMLVEWRGDVALRVAVGYIISTVFEWKPERMVYLG